ncbi:MAG: proton-conducting transporter membrane subunit, partial [bacterium]
MIFNTSFFPIDNLSRFMLILVAVLLPLGYLYSFAYIKRHHFRYYFILILASISLVGIFVSRDLLSFYIFLEMMTVGVYFLIIDNTKKESYAAGFKYILMMFTGGLFILVAALMLYNLTGSFELAVIAKAAPYLPAATVQFIFGIFVIGCLFEIGAVPFHIWLPDAHPIAPSPISALLSGLMIKTGAYGIIRLSMTLNTNNSALIIIGATSMLFGVTLALRQTNIKRLLAYSSISQMGYVSLGIGLGTGLGLGGALFHLLNHATFKSLLFLCLGAVIFRTRERELNKLGGLAKSMPFTALAFIIGALAITGIPPFNGFASKTVFTEAVSNNIWLKTILVITAAGTIATFLKLFLHVFAGKLPVKLKKTKEAPFLMILPMLIVATLCLLIGLFPNYVLNTLVNPAILTGFSIQFFSLKSLTDSGTIILLGTGLYIVGRRIGFLSIEPERRKESLLSWISLDKIVCGLAVLLEAFCLRLRKLIARSLNTYLLWIY